MPAPVIATKLFIPPPRQNAVLRADLIARLNEGLHRRLTLISAPAGFGKTSLASAWIAGCGRPAAWLSLDEGDTDPTRFLAHLVAALQTVAPTLGAGVAASLHFGQICDGHVDQLARSILMSSPGEVRVERVWTPHMPLQHRVCDAGATSRFTRAIRSLENAVYGGDRRGMRFAGTGAGSEN